MRINGCEFFLTLMLLLAGCQSNVPQPTATSTPTFTPAPTVTPAPTATAAPTESPYPWVEVSEVMSGICFESAYDAAGQTFVLHSTEELTRFYDLADNSELCRASVRRGSFDFSSGDILAGLWSRGRGCTAHHEVQRIHRDDTARMLFIFLKLVTEGNCDYELIRPYWIAISGISGYDVQFVVD